MDTLTLDDNKEVKFRRALSVGCLHHVGSLVRLLHFRDGEDSSRHVEVVRQRVHRYTILEQLVADHLRVGYGRQVDAAPLAVPHLHRGGESGHVKLWLDCNT